jgi:DNA-directed RNA polymerase subunit RPC12/RpoP
MTTPNVRGGSAPSDTSQAAAQSFPCRNCGAKLTFDAAAQAMACPFCGYKEAVPAAPAAAPVPVSPPGAPAAPIAPAAPAPGAIREIPLEEGMKMAARGFGAPVTTVTCKDCGANVHVGEGERTTTCAFCGSQQVLAQQSGEQPIRPESLLPFKIAKEEANKRFADWLGGLWFRPSDLRKLAKVHEMGGVYVPFWTFDSWVSSNWTAERGYYYYETETYTTVENGQRVTKTRQVQRTRWEPASGYRRDWFDDVLVCAGRALPTELVDKFSTFDTKLLQPYRPEFLAGWRAEAYAVDLMPAFGTAQQKMARVQEGRCAGDIGGDTHRGLNVSNQFSQTTFKHVLLPIWIAAYRYNGKVYRFLVNGQSGEVVGVAPWSFWKIAALVIVILAVLGVIGTVVARQQNATHPSTPKPSLYEPSSPNEPLAPAPTDTATATASATATAPPPHAHPGPHPAPHPTTHPTAPPAPSHH